MIDLHRCASAALAAASVLPLAAAQSPNLRVDALGYSPDGDKVAVIRVPVIGYDAGTAPFAPGQIEVVRASDGAVVLSGAATPWNGGQTHSTSGDRAWSFDFSAVAGPGTYFVRDAASGARTEDFEIAEDPFAGARRAAARMFFYQRSGFAKVPPFADPRWADGASHLGPLQDLDCRPSVGSGPGLDLSGGWYDAGDYNKYVNFTDGVILGLLGAYEANPGLWDESLGLPESGNGVPDLLDEARFGLEWMLRMQRADGGVLHKVSVSGFQGASPPTADTAQRLHGPVTASATASAAATFARAAVVYGGAGETAFADQLEQAAVLSWGWLQQNPAFSSYDNAGFSSVAAEDPAWEQGMVRVCAAAWLAILTDEPQYHAHVAAHYGAYPGYELTSSGWSSPYQFTYTETLLRYAERVDENAGLRADVRARFLSSMRFAWLPQVEQGLDPYRAWLSDGDHVWGSNRTIASIGAMHAEAARMDPCRAARHASAALDYAHFFHGVNALGLTFLTGAEEFGAENGVREMYHGWFGDGTPFDNTQNGNPGPAPGYVTGGLNRFYAPDAAYFGPPIVPPQSQPPAKSYLDWNTSWPENSWSVTEPSTGYQSEYIRLLALVAPRGAAPRARTYCSPSANSSGEPAHLVMSGPQSLTLPGTALGVVCGPSSNFGLFLFGAAPGRAPAGNGTLCVEGPLRIQTVAALDAGGATGLALDLTSPTFATVGVGAPWHFQFWHRDTTGAGFNFSDAVRAVFVP